MRLRLTPARRRGVEILDDPGTGDDVRSRAMADVARANQWFGGERVVRRALRDLHRALPAQTVLLDVGTGMADLPRHAVRDAARAGISLTCLGLDRSESLLRVVRHPVSGAVVGDALHIPVADDSVDVVLCSQVLHHFVDDDVVRVIAEMHRITRGWVVISDLRRSWVAASGFYVAADILRFDRVTQRDGFTSVLRGFTSDELKALIRDATGIMPQVRRGVFWRLRATWRKSLPP